MKYSLATLPALAAVALAQAPSAAADTAKPAFLNSAFPVTKGKPFTFQYSGCADSCTIEIRNGQAGNLQPVRVITTEATGSSFTWTPKDLPSDTYTFQISNKKGPPNYSIPFSYQGTGAAVSSLASASASAASSRSTAVTPTASLSSASSASSSVASATTASVTSGSSMSVTLSTVAREPTEASSSSPSRNSTATRSGSSSSMRPSSPATTKIPESGVGHISVPLALGGVAAVMAYLF